MSEVIVPNCGLQAKKKKGLAKLTKEERKMKLENAESQTMEDTHIVYFMIFNLLVYMAVLQLLVNMLGIMFTPVHC